MLDILEMVGIQLVCWVIVNGGFATLLTISDRRAHRS